MSTGPRITLEQAEAFVLALFQRRLGYASIEDAAAQGVEVVDSINAGLAMLDKERKS